MKTLCPLRRNSNGDALDEMMPLYVLCSLDLLKPHAIALKNKTWRHVGNRFSHTMHLRYVNHKGTGSRIEKDNTGISISQRGVFPVWVRWQCHIVAACQVLLTVEHPAFIPGLSGRMTRDGFFSYDIPALGYKLRSY
jgi:hypothetical protein